jgi:hypothetical protein
MPKKHFLIVDTETTDNGKVADFGAVVCDKQGNIVASFAALVTEIYTDRVNDPLFTRGNTCTLWGKKSLKRRYARYDAMIKNGSRTLATVPAINRWLAEIAVKYRPVLTAYNLSFDVGVCNNTDIDLSLFPNRFCMWNAAAHRWGQKRAFLQIVLETLAFNPPTKAGNMTYQTKAEPMARFVTGNVNMPAEPHTALEDARDYELPILVALVKGAKVKDYMEAPSYNWRNFQVKDKFKIA